MWDKKPLKLVKTHKHTIRYVLTIQVSKISGIVYSSTYFINKPLNLSSQFVRSSSFSAFSVDGKQMLCDSKLIKTNTNPIYKLFYNKPISNYLLKQEIEVDLFSVKLTQIDIGDGDTTDVVVVEPLSIQERDFYLIQTYPPTEEFKQFIAFNKLSPQITSNGEMESLLCFAYRVTLYIRKIEYLKEAGDQEPMETIRSGKANCTSFSILFSSIMRFNGIPCRTIIGRNAGAFRSEMGHAKNEFYHPSYGFIPVDCSLKDNSVYNTHCFADHSGDLLVLTVENITCKEFNQNEKLSLILPATLHSYNQARPPVFTPFTDNFSILNC